MAWIGWKPDMPVQVVGVKDNQITTDGRGWQVFPNLAAAQQVFPDLNIEGNGSRFTWVMRGEIEGQPAGRFETWPANNLYST